MSNSIKRIKVSDIPTSAASFNTFKNVSSYGRESVVEAVEMDFSEMSFPFNSTDYKNFLDGEYLTSTGDVLVIKDGVASVDGIIIANKTFSLPSDFIPNSGGVELEVMDAFEEMQRAARADNLDIFIKSGYRSYDTQEETYNWYIENDEGGVLSVDTYSARPGHSEHQTGLAIDINKAGDAFTNTVEAKWLNEHASEYGFILRYPEGKTDITGYKYESWHYRYVGEELAKVLYNDGDWITLEEYFGLNSNY